jgi:hypothetical protein
MVSNSGVFLESGTDGAVTRYALTAITLNPGDSGARAFCTDQTGRVPHMPPLHVGSWVRVPHPRPQFWSLQLMGDRRPVASDGSVRGKRGRIRDMPYWNPQKCR